MGLYIRKYSFSNLHILHFRCFILIITVPSCIYEKHFKESIRDKLCIVAILRRARFAKYRFSNLHIQDFRCFIPCLGPKSSLCRVVDTKSVRESAEITYIYSQSSESSFRKIQIIEFAYLHFHCFTRCLGLKIIKCIELYVRKVLKNAKRLVA